MKPARARLRSLAAALAAAVVVGGCGGRDGSEDSSATTAVSAATTTTTTAAATSSSTSSSAPQAPAGQAGGPARGRTPGATGAGGARTARGPTFTAPGRYTYLTTGTVTTLLGQQPRDGETILTVNPPVGSDQRTLRQGPDLVVEQVLRLAADGAYLVHLDQATLGIRKAFRPQPPVLAVPLPPAVGRTWAWHMRSTDGTTTVDAELRVARTETLDVGGERVPVAVVEAIVTTGGEVVSTTRRTLWVSDRYRLVVQQHDVSDGHFGAVTFHSESMEKLRSTRPA